MTTSATHHLVSHRRHLPSAFRGALLGYPAGLTPAGPYAPVGGCSDTGRISTRTRRSTATAAGAAQPVSYYGFGPGRVPWSSSSRVDPRPHAPRPEPPLVVAPGPPWAPTAVPAVLIASDRDRAEPLSAPI